MPVSIAQTANVNRFDVSYQSLVRELPQQGYVMITGGFDDPRYTAHNNDGVALGEPVENLMVAALQCIPNYQELELATAEHCIRTVELAIASPDETTSALSRRLQPRRLESAIAYRDRVLAGKFF